MDDWETLVLMKTKTGPFKVGDIVAATDKVYGMYFITKPTNGLGIVKKIGLLGSLRDENDDILIDWYRLDADRMEEFEVNSKVFRHATPEEVVKFTNWCE